jgi:cardiolipin synthase (CMP-forming)
MPVIVPAAERGRTRVRAVGSAPVAAATPEVGPDRLLTVPNLLSLLRLAGVPLFVYLLLGPHADGWAIAVLALGGVTDWLDGKLARLLGQYSRLGALLDPAVDRLYILAALLALGLRDIVPWWVVLALVARDLVLGACLPVLRARGYRPFQVTYLGKAATFLLLYAFPLLLVGQGTGWFAELARPVGIGIAVWGTALYLYTGLLYLAQFALAVRTPAAIRPG